MKKKPNKRRPEIMKPGLKQQTPLEQQTTAIYIANNKKRWEYLFSLKNRWTLIK